MNLIDLLDIETISLAKDLVILKMPVTDRIKQPYGYVHGGINGVLIETAASLGANQQLTADQFAVGVDLQVNHLAPVKAGELLVRAFPDKIGKRIQVWQAEVYNGELKTAVGRCTLTIA